MKSFKKIMAVLIILAFIFSLVPAAFAERGDIQASGKPDSSGYYPYRVDGNATIRTGYNVTDTHTIGSYGLHINGPSEFDDTVYADGNAAVVGTLSVGTLHMVGNITLEDGQTLTFGTDSDAVLSWDNINQRWKVTMSSGSQKVNFLVGDVFVGDGSPTISTSGESLYVEKTGEFAGILYPLGGIQSADGSNTFTIKDGSGHVAYTCSGGAKNFLITANTVAITGNMTASGTLVITGKITATAGVDASADITSTNSIIATGNIGGADGNFTGGVNASGASDFANSVNIDGNLDAQQALTAETLTVNDTSTFDGEANHNGPISIVDDEKINQGNDADAVIVYSATETQDGLKIGVDESNSRRLIIQDEDDIDSDTGLGAATTPTVTVMSDDSSSSSSWDVSSITFGNGEKIDNSINDQVDIIAGGSTIVSVTGSGAAITGDIEATGGFKISYFFSRENADISWTATVVYCQGLESTEQSEYTMASGGSIIAVAAAGTVAQTTGETIFEVYKNGAGTGLTVTLTDASAYGYSTQAKDLDTFVAGDRLQLRITTNGAVNPTTIDYQAIIIVEQ